MSLKKNRFWEDYYKLNNFINSFLILFFGLQFIKKACNILKRPVANNLLILDYYLSEKWLREEKNQRKYIIIQDNKKFPTLFKLNFCI